MTWSLYSKALGSGLLPRARGTWWRVALKIRDQTSMRDPGQRMTHQRSMPQPSRAWAGITNLLATRLSCTHRVMLIIWYTTIHYMSLLRDLWILTSPSGWIQQLMSNCQPRQSWPRWLRRMGSPKLTTLWFLPMEEVNCMTSKLIIWLTMSPQTIQARGRCSRYNWPQRQLNRRLKL